MTTWNRDQMRSLSDMLEEVLAMARDAMALYLADLVADSEPIPTSTVRRGWPMSRPQQTLGYTSAPSGGDIFSRIGD